MQDSDLLTGGDLSAKRAAMRGLFPRGRLSASGSSMEQGKKAEFMTVASMTSS